MIRNHLLKTVSLPYKSVKGSFEHRQQKAEQFTHKIINNLSGQLEGDGVSLSKFGRSIRAMVPDNLHVYVKKNKETDAYAQFNKIFSGDNQIINQFFEFNTNKNNKIDKLSIPTITHEIRHLADSLYHPKMLAREQLLAKKNLDTDKFYRFYDDDIYIKEMSDGKTLKKMILKDVRNQTMNALKGHSVNDKINLLQFIRYSLISERNAYNEERKAAKKLHKKHQQVYKDALENQSKDYMFDEKIELIQSIAFDIIKKERKIHRALVKKSKKSEIRKIRQTTNNC